MQLEITYSSQESINFSFIVRSEVGLPKAFKRFRHRELVNLKQRQNTIKLFLIESKPITHNIIVQNILDSLIANYVTI